jgi:hypothetical protein
MIPHREEKDVDYEEFESSAQYPTGLTWAP